MFTADASDLRGPVRRLRTETADWDQAARAWGPVLHTTDTEFDRAGRMIRRDTQSGDRAAVRTVYTYDGDGRLIETAFGEVDGPTSRRIDEYDAAGRLERVRTVDVAGVEHVTHTCTYGADGRRTTEYRIPAALEDRGTVVSIEGSEFGYPAAGAARLITRFDDRDLAFEAEVQTADGEVIKRIVLTRDAAGRLVSEEAQDVKTLVPATGMSDEQREKLTALAALAFGTLQTRYSYDVAGRRVRREHLLGSIAEECTTYEYDDHGNTVRVFTSDISREVNLDEADHARASATVVRTNEGHFEYRYDERGNYVERRTSHRHDAQSPLTPDSIERRQIEYWET